MAQSSQYFNRLTGTSQWHRPTDSVDSNNNTRNDPVRPIDVVSTSPTVPGDNRATQESSRVAIALEVARLEKELKDANAKLLNLNSLLQVERIPKYN